MLSLSRNIPDNNVIKSQAAEIFLSSADGTVEPQIDLPININTKIDSFVM